MKEREHHTLEEFILFFGNPDTAGGILFPKLLPGGARNAV